MKNLIFFFITVTLVSFTLCTEQKIQPQEGKPSEPASVSVIHDEKKNETKPAEQGVKEATTVQTMNTNQTVPQNAPTTATNTKEPVPAPGTPTQSSPTTSNETSVPPVQTETKPDEKSPMDNKVPTQKAEESVSPKTTDQVVPNNQTLTNGTKPAETTAKPMNDTKTDGKDKADAVTPKNEPPKSVVTPEDKTVLATRAFDGASFVGGIVLTLGLLAISFVGFKYYKNLTKENYHIL